MVGETPNSPRYRDKVILFSIKMIDQIETYALVSNFCFHLKNRYGSGIPLNTVRYITRW